MARRGPSLISRVVGSDGARVGSTVATRSNRTLLASRSTIPRTIVAPPVRRVVCRRAAAGNDTVRLSPAGAPRTSIRLSRSSAVSIGRNNATRSFGIDLGSSKPPCGTKYSWRPSVADEDDRCGAGMQVRETTIGQLISGERGEIRVPIFQRPYAWTTQELGQFWADILGQYQEIQRPTPGSTHFLGSIVLMPEAGAFESSNSIRDPRGRPATTDVRFTPRCGNSRSGGEDGHISDWSL